MEKNRNMSSISSLNKYRMYPYSETAEEANLLDNVDFDAVCDTVDEFFFIPFPINPRAFMITFVILVFIADVLLISISRPL